MIFLATLLAVISVSTSFCSQLCALDQFPDETIKLIFVEGRFKDIKSLVLVCKRFRQTVPLFYYRDFEETCIKVNCGLMSVLEASVDISLTPWAAIGLDEDLSISSDLKIKNTAFLMLHAGFIEPISSKIRKFLFKHINTEPRKILFRDCLIGILMNMFPEVPWEFWAISNCFTDYNPFLYPSFHIPLLELGCHPRPEDVIYKMLAVVVNFDCDIEERRQVVNADKIDHPIYSAAKQVLKGPSIEKEVLLEYCHRIADAVYYFYGEEKTQTVLDLFHHLFGDEFAFDYDELNFQTRIEVDKKNIYRLLVTLELLSCCPANMVNHLRHPLLYPTFMPFFSILQNIVNGLPISIDEYSPLMLESLRCFLRLPSNRQYKAHISHSIWQTEDNSTIGLLLSSSPVCYAVDFFERAATKKGKMIFPLAFGRSHWPLIYRLAAGAPHAWDYIVDWILDDILAIIRSRDSLSVLIYNDLLKRSFAFKQIYSLSYRCLVLSKRISQDDAWILLSLIPRKNGHFIGRMH